MARKSTLILLLILGISSDVCVSCRTQEQEKGKQTATDAAAHVLATVNGVAIGREDVRQALQRSGHGKQATHETEANVLETLIRQELIYQRAVELGLDRDPGFQERRRRLEAQIRAVIRNEMTDLFFKTQIDQQARVSDSEARAFFEKNRPLIRTEFHVWQLLYKGNEGLARASLAEINRGTPFEEVAARRFANLPQGSRPPWDLGFLRWDQIPQAWQRVIQEMKKGEVSDILRGEGKRFWVLKLVDRRENRSLSFDQVKSSIMRVLKAQKVNAQREKTEKALRARARISYFGR